MCKPQQKPVRKNLVPLKYILGYFRICPSQWSPKQLNSELHAHVIYVQRLRSRPHKDLSLKNASGPRDPRKEESTSSQTWTRTTAWPMRVSFNMKRWNCLPVSSTQSMRRSWLLPVKLCPIYLRETTRGSWQSLKLAVPGALSHCWCKFFVLVQQQQPQLERRPPCWPAQSSNMSRSVPQEGNQARGLPGNIEHYCWQQVTDSTCHWHQHHPSFG